MDENLEALRVKLDQKQKELDLVLAIDRVRDTTLETSAMLVAIVDGLVDQLRADLGLICLRDRETGEIHLKAISDRSQLFGQLEIREEFAERVSETDDITIWTRDEARSLLGFSERQLEGLPRQGETLQLAIIPITMGKDERLGALLLVNSLARFDSDDVALLKTAESCLDSAVMQAYAHDDLQQRTRELETIYRVDRIRDRNLSFDEMLDAVLQELCTVIRAEMGFVMLYNRTGYQLELRAATHDDLFRMSPQYTMVEQVANEALRRSELTCHNDLGGTLSSLMCIPLILRNEIIGVLGVGNRYGPSGFDSADRRLFNAIGSQMDTAIFEGLERRRLRQVLGRSVDPRVLERLLENPDVGFLRGERSVLTVLYADLRDSTSLAEHTDPELLVGFVNDSLGRMADVILSREGTLDKFVGDGVMALFGAPFPQSDHALRAVQVGLEIQEAHQKVMQAWQAHDLVPAPIGVGIATGEMTVGEMGSSQRTDYTAIGRAANLGARICGAAKAGQVLVSQATYDLIKERVDATPITGLQLKGVDQDVTAYHIIRVI